MAVRLAVIMVQTPPARGANQQLTEAVLGELLGRPGIDVILVSRLDALGEDSTDRLTLESHSGDAAVLDWQKPEATVEALSGIGFCGMRAPHEYDPHPAAADASERRIYAFDLHDFKQASEVREALQRLLESRRVRTFSLGDAVEQSERVTVPRAQPQSPSRPPRPSQQDTSKQSTSHADEPSPSSANLDALVDQLDELDP